MKRTDLQLKLKEQIQHNIGQGGSHQQEQRRARIPQGGKNAGADIVLPGMMDVAKFFSD